MSVIVNPTGSSGGTSIGGNVVGGTSPAILFINPNGVLAQDPTNFGWDSTNKILLIESQNAIYRVPNAAGDNWFEGGAGNTSLTGSNNFGTGNQSLTSLTTGSFNVAIGDLALLFASTANNNVAIGSQALRFLTVSPANNNTAIGASALFSCSTGHDNTVLGFQGLFSLTDGVQNVCIGAQNLSQGVHISGNIAISGGQTLTALGSGGTADGGNIGIGNGVFSGMTTGNNNVGIGGNTGNLLPSGSNNTLLGIGALLNANVASSNNSVIGFLSFQTVTQASGCTILGPWNGPSAAVSNVIALIDGGNASHQPKLDWNYTTTNVWSAKWQTNPQGLHVYNTFDDVVPTVNYERAIFDWNPTANTLSIGTQAGGTGTLRNIKFIGGTVSFPAAAIIEAASTVAGLPTAGTVGRRAFVTDATVTTFASVVAGTGTNGVPVYDDGANWRIG